MPFSYCKNTDQWSLTSIFGNLLEIVRLFPHYFVGSNADLPIVGGLMLAQDHYQGGRLADFPMMKAPLDRKIKLAGFDDVDAGIVNFGQCPRSDFQVRHLNR